MFQKALQDLEQQCIRFINRSIQHHQRVPLQTGPYSTTGQLHCPQSRVATPLPSFVAFGVRMGSHHSPSFCGGLFLKSLYYMMKIDLDFTLVSPQVGYDCVS